MTAEVQEILPTGDLIVDGDIRSAGDFSHDELPDPNPEQIHAVEVLRIISAWDAAEDFKMLARRGAKDPAVRRLGGLRGCAEKSRQKQNEARRIFLVAHDYPIEKPDEEDELLDEYYEGVRAWATFREELSNDEIRSNMKEIFERKIPSTYKRGEE